MEFAKYVLSVLIGGGLLGFIGKLLERRWQKTDRQEEKEEKKDEATISELKDEIKHLADEIREDKQTTKLVVEAQKVTMVERIRYLCVCYLSHPDKKIDLEEKEQMRKMHKAYKALGGNGDLDTVIGEVEKMEVRNPKEK